MTVGAKDEARQNEAEAASMKIFRCDVSFKGATPTAEISWRRTKYEDDKNEWLDGRIVSENDHDIPYDITSVIPVEVQRKCMKTAVRMTGNPTKQLPEI
jgi:hypothetical protein